MRRDALRDAVDAVLDRCSSAILPCSTGLSIAAARYGTTATPDGRGRR